MRFQLTLRGSKYQKLLMCVLVTAMSAAAMGQAGAGQKNAPASGIGTAPNNTAQDNANAGNALTIEPAELPVTYPHGPFQVHLHVRGNYVPTLHWSVVKGTLPPGITLDDNGVLRGEARRAGEFQFTMAARDGSQPPQTVEKSFVLKVVDAIMVAWKVPAHVNVNRIEGSVEVSNMTVDDVDLTFDVKAVAENGRATEIGYQHFPLKRQTIAMVLPFGETLPPGSYAVYVDVNGEVAARNAIYKQELQTPGPLQIAVGP